MEWRRGFHGPLGSWLLPSPDYVPLWSRYLPPPGWALGAFRQLFKECLNYLPYPGLTAPTEEHHGNLFPPVVREHPPLT